VTDRTVNFLVGLASIGAVVGLAALMLLFGELDAVVRPRYLVRINTDHAAGLRAGSGVELNGVPIGIIDDVRVEGDTALPVQVDALIDMDVHLPTAAAPYATSSLLGGTAVLEIDAPTGATSFLPKDGTATIDSPIRFRMIEQLRAELDARMDPVIRSLERFDDLSATYLELGQNLNGLLEPQSPEDLAAGDPPNLRTILSTSAERLDDVGEALELARAWLGDEQLRNDARAAVENASGLIERATEAVTRLTLLADTIEEDADTIVGRLLPVADEIGRTLEEVRRIAKLAREGPGTISLLLNNPDLYESLDDAARRLEQAARDAELLMEKIKAEGVPLNL
jgi:ABC-type transporter Mla subunit MlaD